MFCHTKAFHDFQGRLAIGNPVECDMWHAGLMVKHGTHNRDVTRSTPGYLVFLLLHTNLGKLFTRVPMSWISTILVPVEEQWYSVVEKVTIFFYEFWSLPRTRISHRTPRLNWVRDYLYRDAVWITWNASNLMERQLEIILTVHLVVDDIIVTVIHTLAVRSSVDCLCNTLNVGNFRYDAQRPTSATLWHKIPCEIMLCKNNTRNLHQTDNQQINKKSSNSIKMLF